MVLICQVNFGQIELFLSNVLLNKVLIKFRMRV